MGLGVGRRNGSLGPAVAAFVEDSPDRAAKAWSGHPDAEIALGMTEIGITALLGTRA